MVIDINDPNKQEIRSALMTYMQATGAHITKDNTEEYDISEKEIIGCHKFYKMYMVGK